MVKRCIPVFQTLSKLVGGCFTVGFFISWLFLSPLLWDEGPEPTVLERWGTLFLIILPLITLLFNTSRFFKYRILKFFILLIWGGTGLYLIYNAFWFFSDLSHKDILSSLLFGLPLSLLLIAVFIGNFLIVLTGNNEIG